MPVRVLMITARPIRFPSRPRRSALPVRHARVCDRPDSGRLLLRRALLADGIDA